jgi:leader peptidase (prepilin peptidase) / N-methyltransferase
MIQGAEQARRSEPARRMIRVLGKTAGRTRLFLGGALAWRAAQRPYAPLAWCLIAGWVWLMAGLRGDPAWTEITLAALYLCGVLAAVCAIDARHGIIPNSLVAALAAGGLIEIALIGPPDRLRRVFEAGAFFLAAWLFRAAYHRIRGFHGLGFGDVKFATAGVLWIGIAATPLLLIMAVISALASLMILRADGHSLDRQQAIPFGPHLAIGLWLSWIFDVLQPVF